MLPTQRHRVVWRSGGELCCSWQRTYIEYSSRELAQEGVSEFARAGYKALAFPSALLEEVGLPIGWTRGCVDWVRDSISVTSERTQWRSYLLPEARLTHELAVLPTRPAAVDPDPPPKATSIVPVVGPDGKLRGYFTF